MENSFLKEFTGKRWVKYHGPLLLQNKLLVLATDKNAYWFSPEDGGCLIRRNLGKNFVSSNSGKQETDVCFRRWYVEYT